MTEVRHKISVDAIVFDFDGVLVESVNVKGDAFYQLYEQEGQDIQQKVLEYHLKHGGVSRFDKIRYFEEEFLDRSASEEDVNRIAGRFSDLVEDKVVESDWVNGAREFLDGYSGRLPLFVASATPQDELERIVERRTMSRYFKAVFGSPKKKGEHLKAILAEYGWEPQRVLMVGDTVSDYKAAREAGTAFIGRHIENMDDPFPSDTTVIKDLTSLPDLIDV